VQILTAAEWRAATEAHEARVDALTAGHRARRAHGRKHPVEDFLFSYYPWTPAQLRRWHPGAGVALEASATAPQQNWRFYVATGDRPGRFGCFGLHEWAMVYRLGPEEVRHAAWPLRLGQEATDAVVESHQIACSHFDAYRFFTPEAAPRNLLRPTRAGQAAYEQPGCLHAGMDLYKWAMKLSPAVGSDLILDAFVLARDVRELDMRAAPYDLRELGYEPVPIETPEGKAEYVAAQRGFSERGQRLRGRLLDTLDGLLAQVPAVGSSASR
jgi:hypothetical protein